MLKVISIRPEARWPAIPSPRGSQLLALQFQLEQSQWLSRSELDAVQSQQLARVAMFAASQVPFYRDRLSGLRLSDGDLIDPTEWQKIPTLSRLDLQQAGTSIHSPANADEQKSRVAAVTSGSTGTPVATISTTLTRLIWYAITLRQHIWQRRDLSCKFAAIRLRDTPEDQLSETARAESWGTSTVGVIETGPAAALDIRNPIERQAEWLVQENPDYLLTYPSNALALVRYFSQHRLRLKSLRELRTFGEMLDPQLRPLCQQVWNVPLVDNYSSQEVGYIALQCPSGDGYHIQSENVLVEVINAFGQPCGPSEIGRVVVSTLQNFASPLLRYEIGDYAEIGPPCPCGRGLPMLKRIMGRKRNMFRLPTGEQFWPSLSMEGDTVPHAAASIRQYQIIQRSVEKLEARLVAPQPLGSERENELTNWLAHSFGYRFQVIYTYVPEIERGTGGKFEDFRSEVS